MTPHQSDDTGALSRRERRRLPTPVPSFGEVAGGARGTGKTTGAAGDRAVADPHGGTSADETTTAEAPAGAGASESAGASGSAEISASAGASGSAERSGVPAAERPVDETTTGGATNGETTTGGTTTGGTTTGGTTTGGPSEDAAAAPVLDDTAAPVLDDTAAPVEDSTVAPAEDSTVAPAEDGTAVPAEDGGSTVAAEPAVVMPATEWMPATEHTPAEVRLDVVETLLADARGGEAGLAGEEPDGVDETHQIAEWAGKNSPATALLWLDPATVAETGPPDATDDEATANTDILADAPRRGPRAGWLVPLGALLVLGIAYSATALLWPLHELPASVQAVELTATPSEPAAITWPAQGSAAVGVGGVGIASSAGDAVPIASVTKVVSALLVLDRMPLQVGEQGPKFSFTRSDSRRYWSYLRDNQSALDVPVGGTLSEYQMLQGILLGSANNYIDRLADEVWGSEEEFVAAAREWLSSRGLGEITIVSASGRDSDNVATPQSLIRLAEIAMANPVFAEIAATASVDLPGAGTVKNSNGLLGEPGIVGVKTGTLGGRYNLLSAKDVAIGDTTVHLYAAVLGQPDDDTRLAASRALFTELEAALLAQAPAVAAGTIVGEVSTPWGADVDIVTDADATVVLWEAATATTDVVFDLGDASAEGEDVGTLTVTGPVNGVEVPVSLAEDLPGPTAWWRLTHPLELFGVID